jgi:DNA helicase-2/ATP-dependent DNA helicase PcrA
VDIAQELVRLPEYQSMNIEQRAILSHGDGPLRVIAGPGSGKTHCLTLRAMNLLLQKKAEPSELVLCTYTEKAAHELHARMIALAEKTGYQDDLSQMRTSTIHSICNRLIMEYRHYTPLGNDYKPLDQSSQWLFLFRHLEEIGKEGALNAFYNKWGRGKKWEIVKQLQVYFDKIMEEVIDVDQLLSYRGDFRYHLAQAYCRYQKILLGENCVGFAALQKIAYDLLNNPPISDKITQGIRYVFVDEYQDTNYIQEQIVLKLASATGNICIIGDEDQALYRFRGATVRNILEFADRIPDCTTLQLTTNYRSHAKIVQAYDQWMRSVDWSNPKGASFRTEKHIRAHENTTYQDYPAVLAIQGNDQYDEAEQFAELVQFLKHHDIISDYSQVALLLHSVRSEYSGHYIEALQARDIQAFCPRARSYFENAEVCLLVACFARLLGYHGETQNGLIESEYFATYASTCIKQLDENYSPSHPLQTMLRELEAEITHRIEHQHEEQGLPLRLADYFYRLLAVEPFACFADEESVMHNLVIFSKMLETFQTVYQPTHASYTSRERITHDFFNAFLCLLKDDGLNEYEDEQEPFPPGHVQIMTIHQAKGLEFPVVAVGGLHKANSAAEPAERELHPFFFNQRKQFEPENRIALFDLMRLYYVAFSRAEKLLVLMGNKRKPTKQYFDTIWRGLPHWPYIQHDLLKVAEMRLKPQTLLKPRYSFTGHIQTYETCPRQYEFLREYNFVPSRQKDAFLGLLVHQTIEGLHRAVLDGKFATLNEQQILALLDRTYTCLLCHHTHPLDPSVKKKAFTQVWNYFIQNQREIQSIIESEVDITLEKKEYILVGRIDLLMERNGKLELLDFKTSTRPMPNADVLLDYERQLYIYAHTLAQRHRKPIEKLFLYWTEEPHREDALMEFRYSHERAEHISRSIDAVVTKIKRREFHIITPPEQKVCKRCDRQYLCIKEGVIKPSCSPDLVR